MAINLGPRPPYYNPTIEPENYQPSVFNISNITIGSSTTVTTSSAHNFVVGQLVRFHIPSTYRTRQLNGLTGYVTSVASTTQVIVNINSTDFDAFDASPSYGPTSPQIAAIGDTNQPLANTNGRTNLKTTISGAFQNISS